MFYIIKDNKIKEWGNYKFSEDCKEIVGISMEEYNKDKDRLVIKGDELIFNPDYAEILVTREKERIANLRCTKRVLALVLKELGVSYANLQAIIATSEDAQLEWDLCVELERSNPLLDILGAQLGLTPTTIDKIFKYANGEIGKEDFDETDMVKGGIANG